MNTFLIFGSFIVLLSIKLCESANILYVMPFTAKSHYIGMKNLALELANRGHEVYAITPYREEVHPPTYHHLMVDCVSVWNRMFDERPNVFSMIDLSFTEFQTFLYRVGFIISEIVKNSTEVQEFFKEDHKIDLVINEVFFNEALYMLAHKYQAPLVLVTTFGNSFKTNYYLRNPLQLSTVYHEYGSATEPLSFVDRLRNLYFFAYDLLMLKFWYMPRQEEYARSYFKELPEPVPSLEELAANAALVLMNSHFSVDTPVAYLPNFIEVAGLHVKETNKTLPEDLQKTLDGAKNGVVFLSFGSNVHSSELGEDKLNAFLNVFGELKQTVLMKWEDTNLPKVPKNVILRKWFPQREVLAHPNIKLFIGHGGLLGLQESIVAGVPILGIPVFGDQYLNIKQVADHGSGELLEYKDITEERFRNVVNKMLNDTRYLRKAKEVAARFKDRPMSGLETAVWWTEYVIRHKGATFMKSPALQLNYFAYNMLDVYLFLMTVFLSIVYVICKIFFYFLKRFSFKKTMNKQKIN